MKKINLLIPISVFTLAIPLVNVSTSCSSNSIANKIVVDTTTRNSLAYQIVDAVKNTANQTYELVESNNGDGFIVLDKNNKTIKELTSSLSEDSYRIKYHDNRIYIAATSGIARNCAVQRLLKDYLTNKGFELSINLDVKGTCKASDHVIELYDNIVTPSVKINKYRDPYIYKEGSDYYMVATGTTADSQLVGDDWWHLWKASGDFKDPDTKWYDLGYVIDDTIEHADLIKGDRWAPELYRYTNPDTKETNYYIFTTFATKSATANEPARGRGCAVFRSNKLVDKYGKAAKFELISYYGDKTNLGRITNPEQSCIDGHLYIENKTPYMVFVEEFTDFSPQDGRMFVAQMSNDLTHFVSDAKEIFKATDAPWVSQEPIQDKQFRVTDGPFIHKMSNGQLVMLWSSYFDAESKQYCMGYATADNIMGPWTHHRRLIYDEYMLEGYTSPYVSNFSLQGGHGMIFTDTNNKMYMCIHCGAWDKQEHPFIFPIKEANGLLVWDLY